MNPIIEKIRSIFEERGSEQYGTEAVTQLQHALQSGQLAEESGAPESLVVSALLHDIGHIFKATSLPESCVDNLDDKHEFVANAWIKAHFGPEVADPIRLHVVAKRYLCTKYPKYETKLSPTSFKSYHDQGGPMSPEEMTQFESEPFYKEALELRKWDDLAKAQDKVTPPFSHFIPALESCLK
jgi:phosphonate degradation associated HDIG domain protein